MINFVDLFWKLVCFSSGSGGRGSHSPPVPVKISHKKDGSIDFMFLGPPYPAARSATVFSNRTSVELYEISKRRFIEKSI